MAKKISKIISNAKNRLSKAKLSSKPSSSSPSSSLPSKTSSSSSTSKSSSLLTRKTSSLRSTLATDKKRLLNNDNNSDSISLILPSSQHQQQPENIDEEYDDFESPDLNLSLKKESKNSEQRQNEEQQQQKNENRSSSIIQSILSFGGVKSNYNELDNNDNNEQTTNEFNLFNYLNNNRPILFGTWNGVFITTFVHLFGVISFLRLGYILGIDGIPLTILIIFICFLFNTISLLSAIGIIERCTAITTTTSSSPSLSSLEEQTSTFYGLHPFNQYSLYNEQHQRNQHNENNKNIDYKNSVLLARANIHILISTILGSRIGGAISIIYCLGQSLTCALHLIGFSESFIQLLLKFLNQQIIYVDNNVLITNSTTNSNSTIILKIINLLHINHQNNQQHLIVNDDTIKIISIILIIILFIINIIGIRWLFRLQTILFLSLMLAILNFIFGVFYDKHNDYGFGTMKLDGKNFFHNIKPMIYDNNQKDDNQNLIKNQWIFWQQLFETIGIFFPTTIGVMAGINMSNDLKKPIKSIPNGSFIAIILSLLIHLLFIILLSLTCNRFILLNDLQITQHLSLWYLFYLCGLYMSTISSSLGSMYTAPRIIQNLSQEFYSIKFIRIFSRGTGKNNQPINSLLLFITITIIIIIIIGGNINLLATIITIPYLLTYSIIEYSYFSIAMTFDIQIQREKRFMKIATQLNNNDDDLNELENQQDNHEQQQNNDEIISINSINNKKIIEQDTISLTTSLSGFGGNGSKQQQLKSPSLSPSISSLQQQQQQQHLAGYGSITSITQHIKIKRRQSTQSSDDSDDNNDFFPKSTASNIKQSTSTTSSLNNQQHHHKAKKPKTIKQLMAAVSNSDDDDDDEDENDDDVDNTYDDDDDNISIKVESINKNNCKKNEDNIDDNDNDNDDDDDDDEIKQQQKRLIIPDSKLTEISYKQRLWYLRLINRWIVLISAIIKLLLMFIIAWHYTIIIIIIFIFLLWIIGYMNPGYYPGVTEFSLYNWLRMIFIRIRQWRPSLSSGSYQNIVNFQGSNQDQQPNLSSASYSYERIILPDTIQPNFHCESDQLTKNNIDYIDRPKCHFTTTINPQLN